MDKAAANCRIPKRRAEICGRFWDIPLIFASQGIEMQVSREVRKKLATLIGSIISRCLREARLIPYILTQEEAVNILVDDPMQFERLLREEMDANVSSGELTITLDALIELGKIDSLDQFEDSSWLKSEAEIASILDLTNQLSRTFAVYLGNASTIFDKSFQDFMNRFRDSMQRASMGVRKVDFTLDDVSVLEDNAESFLKAGEFLQAFMFDRLLTSQILIKQVVNLPAQGFVLREALIRSGLNHPDLWLKLARFVLRISYVSQGAWEDLFPILARLAREKQGLCSSSKLIDLIERDIVFSCNLLCKSYAELRKWSPVQRRTAIESSLAKGGTQA
jgi:hypothetical protein